MEFYLYQKLWRLPLPIRHPQMSIHFCEKMRYRVSIDYIQPFGNLQLPKKVVWEKSRGGCNNPSSEDEG